MMMTISSNPTVQVPPWDWYIEDPTANIHSPFSVSPSDDLIALQRYLPSNIDVAAAIAAAAEDDEDDGDIDFPSDVYSCDHFRMYEFKVRRCARGRSHDWTECPFAHPGEKARRRDPRKVHYSGTPCPEFRKGQCKKGDGCEFAHGVFECWLHPSRYRTQPCKDGTQCRRRVCFFAHTPDQLRVLPNSPRNVAANESYDGSPSRLAMDSFFTKGGGSLYSPPCSPPSESPPMSPGLNSAVSAELASSIRNLQIGSSNVSRMNIRPGFCSPRSPSTLRPGFMSLPATPVRSGPRVFDLWENGRSFEEEPVMERVESGRELRAKIYSKLSKENSLARANSTGQGPDLDWVSELVN